MREQIPDKLTQLAGKQNLASPGGPSRATALPPPGDRSLPGGFGSSHLCVHF